MRRSRVATIVTLVAFAGTAVVAWSGLQLVLADPAPTGSPTDQPTGEPVELAGGALPGRTGTDGESCEPAATESAAKRAQDAFVEEYGLGPSSPLSVNGVGLSRRTDVPAGAPDWVVSVIATPGAPTADRPSCADGVQLVWVDGGPMYGGPEYDPS